MKKGEWHWEQIGKLLIALFFMVVLLTLIYIFREKILELLDKIKEALTYG